MAENRCLRNVTRFKPHHVQPLKSVSREFAKVVSRLIGLQQKEGLETSPLLLQTKIVCHVSQTLVERTLFFTV